MEFFVYLYFIFLFSFNFLILGQGGERSVLSFGIRAAKRMDRFESVILYLSFYSDGS